MTMTIDDVDDDDDDDDGESIYCCCTVQEFDEIDGSKIF